MDYKIARQKISTAVCAVLLCIAGSAIHAQKRPANDRTLANFERDIDAGKLTETEKPLLQFALTDPNNARAIELMGRLRLKQGRLRESLSLYRRVLTLEPGFVTAKINYGRALLMAGQADAARQVLDEINPAEIKETPGRLNLSDALALAGECQAVVNIVDTLPATIRNGDGLPILGVCYLRLGETEKFEAL